MSDPSLALPHCSFHLRNQCHNNSVVNILHLNVQSIRNKLDELNMFLSVLPVQILCLNEHWLHQSEINLYVPSNYILIDIFCRNVRNYGGVAIYLRRNFDTSFNTLDLSQICKPLIFEVVGVRFNRLKLILISLYRSPNTSIDNFIDGLDDLYNFLETFPRYKCILVGDINIDVLRPDSVKVHKLQSALSSYNWAYFNCLPTRKFACLDNVIALSDSTDFSCGTVTPGLSDHSGVWISYSSQRKFNFTTIKNIDKITTRKIRSLKILNITNLRNHLSLFDYDSLLGSLNNVNSAWCLFVQVLQEGLNVYCPLQDKITSHKSGRNNFPWFNQTLRYYKDELLYWYSQTKNDDPLASQIYNKLKKKFRQRITDAKIFYNDEIIHNSLRKGRTAWSIIKEESAKNKYSFSSDISANAFNEHFVSCSPFSNNLTSDINSTPNIHPNNNKFLFQSVSYSDVILQVKRFKSTFSEDCFGLSTYVTKHIIDIIAEPLCYLINISITNGIFPDILKNTIIVPIYKKGDMNDPSNYRPIALVPILSKIFESLLLAQLNLYIGKYKLLDDCQFGFRSGLGTLDAVEKVVSAIYNNFEVRSLTSVSFLDLSKAFDSISHPLLIQKVKLYGISDTNLDLLRSYLLNRKQVVKVNGELSDPRMTNRGVPQGSVLGPLLFILFINDITKALEHTPVLYADDTTIILTNNSLDQLIVDRENELLRAGSWFRHNELTLNTSKTENIVFSLNTDIVNSNSNRSVKYLGVYLDDTLSWNTHIDFLIRKLVKNFYLLRKLKYCISSHLLRQAFHAYYQSHINYGILFWGGATRWKEIFLWQKKAIRLILGLANRESCRGCFKELSILTVPCLYIFTTIVHTRKNLGEYTTGSQIHNYNTRNKNLIITPKYRLMKSNRSYLIQGTKFLNVLPTEIRNLPMDIFKRAVKKILIQCEGYSWIEILDFLKVFDYSSVKLTTKF